MSHLHIYYCHCTQRSKVTHVNDGAEVLDVVLFSCDQFFVDILSVPEDPRVGLGVEVVTGLTAHTGHGGGEGATVGGQLGVHVRLIVAILRGLIFSKGGTLQTHTYKTVQGIDIH